MDALPAGAPVELRGDVEEGFPFAWLDATLLRRVRPGDAAAGVRLTHITEDDGSACVEQPAVARLRPPAPGCSRAEALLRLADVYPPGSHVAVRVSDVWWEAVVQDVPGSRDAIVVTYKGTRRRWPDAPGPCENTRLRAAPASCAPQAAPLRLSAAQRARAPRGCGVRVCARAQAALTMWRALFRDPQPETPGA